MGWTEEEVALNAMNRVTPFRVSGLEDPSGYLSLTYILKLAEVYENYAVGIGYYFSSSQPLQWQEKMRAEGFARLKQFGCDHPVRDVDGLLSTSLSQTLRGHSIGYSGHLRRTVLTKHRVALLLEGSPRASELLSWHDRAVANMGLEEHCCEFRFGLAVNPPYLSYFSLWFRKARASGLRSCICSVKGGAFMSVLSDWEYSAEGRIELRKAAIRYETARQIEYLSKGSGRIVVPKLNFTPNGGGNSMSVMARETHSASYTPLSLRARDPRRAASPLLMSCWPLLAASPFHRTVTDGGSTTLPETRRCRQRSMWPEAR